MKLNGISVKSIRKDGAKLYAVLRGTDMEQIKAIPAWSIKVLDGVGNVIFDYLGFTQLEYVKYLPIEDTFEVCFTKQSEQVATLAANQDRDGLLIDLEYRLTLVELGIV